MNDNLGKEFGLYGRDMGVSSMDLYYANKRIEGSMTPYIIEERQLNMTQIDVFSRLLAERIIWLGGVVDDKMAIVTQAQLMFLDSVAEQDITLHISSPGGSVEDGLSIIALMDYIKSDVRTINTCMAASMGAVLLGAGTKGKRNSLKFSRTMLHASSGGANGNIHDARVTIIEWEKINKQIFELLSEYTGKSYEQVSSDTTRDLWLNPQEALEYGIIDEIITKKK